MPANAFSPRRYAMTEDQRTTLTAALTAAAEVYQEAAERFAKYAEPGTDRVQEQFARQHREAIELRETLEQVECIVLHVY